MTTPRSNSESHSRCWAKCVLAVLIGLASTFEIAHAESEAPAAGFFLRDGDCVVFYGDSITEQAHYTQPIEEFVLTRCPGANVCFVNSGWGGDRAWGGDGGMLDVRLARDVIPYQPTVVTVMLGMNDGYYMDCDSKAVAAYVKSLETLVDTLQRELPGVRITLIGSSPYDEVTPGEQPDWERKIDGGYNAVVARFSAAAREVANRYDLLFVDMNEPLVELLNQLQATNPELARELIPDRIHPGPAAGLVMAARLLKVWNAPNTAFPIDIDATENANGVFRTRKELPLPLPVNRNDPLTMLLFEMRPDLKSISADTLRVTHWPHKQASVAIDGKPVGVFSAEELVAGIDLSTLDTALSTRAAEVAEINRLRDRLHFCQWRKLEIPLAEKSGNTTQAVAELAAIEQDLAKLTKADTRPTTHTIELSATEQ